MLKRYKNQLFKTIQEKGIDPKLFHAEEKQIENSNIFVVKLTNTPLTFLIRNSKNNFHQFDWRFTKFKPTFQMTGYKPNVGWASSEILNDAFSYWIEHHAKPYILDQIEPDLWERIALQAPLVTGSELVPEDTEVFSDDERARLRMSINEFRLLVMKTFEPSSDELKVIDDRLEYLSNSVDRLNKIDWRSVAITTLISISMALALDAEKGRLLFNLFLQVFSGVLYLIQ